MPQRILAADVSEEALQLARRNAEKAGVAADIHFQRHAFADLTSKRSYGCVICNPPYGQRMGGQAEIQDLYRAMPNVFRRLKTWSFYVLTAHPDFEALLGQEAHRRRKLYNGRIECTYYQYYGPKPGAAVAVVGPPAEAAPPSAPDEPAAAAAEEGRAAGLRRTDEKGHRAGGNLPQPSGKARGTSAAGPRRWA